MELAEDSRASPAVSKVLEGAALLSREAERTGVRSSGTSGSLQGRIAAANAGWTASVSGMQCVSGGTSVPVRAVSDTCGNTRCK